MFAEDQCCRPMKHSQNTARKVRIGNYKPNREEDLGLEVSPQTEFQHRIHVSRRQVPAAVHHAIHEKDPLLSAGYTAS
jgi:hypothetical protein